MVVTGAGPGIMQAAMEGAGRERSIGVSIRLPFEQAANPIIAGDEKSVSMKYFFTRKLMLVKESRAFVSLPGGFGTLDETFELLTLTQTGKGLPVPIVLLDAPGDPFWRHIDDFVHTQLITRGLVNEADSHLYLVTDSSDAACAEIEHFYANFDSIRYVGNQAVIRLRHDPTDEQLALLDQRFAAIVASGHIERSGALPIEIRQHDHTDLPRIRFEFARHRYSDLRALIDLVNSFRHPRVERPPGSTLDDPPIVSSWQASAAFSTARRAWVSARSASGRLVAPSATASCSRSSDRSSSSAAICSSRPARSAYRPISGPPGRPTRRSGRRGGAP